MPPQQELRAFWTGPSLSVYEQLSLLSFVQAGARVQLFTYDNDLAVPDGVERVDANEILPGPVHGFRRASGDTSFALHSDLFRYVALERFGGWYADLDIVFIGDRLPAEPFFVARQTVELVNGAVLKCPPHHPMMRAAILEARRLLPETAASGSHEARILIGPSLVTRLVAELDLAAEVRPRSSAYEIGYDEIRAFFDPSSRERVEERLAHSPFTHLWNEVWRWIRIPKALGPPEGSYLDALLQRAGIKVPPRARLSYGEITDWFRAHRLTEDCKHWLKTERVLPDAIERVFYMGWTFATQGGAQPGAAPAAPRPNTPRAPPKPLVAALKPQVVQTFWHGDVIGPYQLACLHSFVERGHEVELFTYSRQLRLPGWIERRAAAEIIAPDKVLHPYDGGVAIHGALFRHAVLHRRGGWWVDPDILLLQPDLPAGTVVVAGPDEFGRAAPGVLRAPKGHPAIEAGLMRALALGGAVAAWDAADAASLAALMDARDPEASSALLGPVSWFEVPALFDPARRDDLARRCRTARVLRLHTDVWRRSGVPLRLAPPPESFLDALLTRHALDASFVERMSFDEVNRWISHMYECTRARQRAAEVEPR